MFTPLLAILETERDPLVWREFWSYLNSWVQIAGGFSAVALVIYLLYSFSRSDSEAATDQTRARWLPLILVFAALAAVAYVGAGVFAALQPPDPPLEERFGVPYKPPPPPSAERDWKERFLTIGGALALVGLGIPFLADLSRVRPRRVWALAKLSFKEAVRRRILWVFVGLLLLFLFPPKWFTEVKATDEVRVSVAVIELATAAVMILAFGLLAAFSIPTDLRNQTIHTIVTKPVERFEIVLGRFFGYVALATIVLFVLRGVSLGFIIFSRPSDEARAESFQARDPVYGELEFRNKQGKFEGESVGREWDYRKYVAGNSSQRAVFVYRDLPPAVTNPADDVVFTEFAFDIFRTTKGEENKGVQVSLFFVTPSWSDAKLPEYQAEMQKLGLSPGYTPSPDRKEEWNDWLKKANQLSEKFGYFEVKGREIADYHTFRVAVPAGVFRAAAKAMASGPARPDAPPPLEVRTKCESRTQFLGVAKRDLYLLAGNHSFELNFMKGAFGLWLMVTLVIGIAVSLSTYLSGVVSWLAAMFVVGFGFLREFMQEIADGRLVGGGPTESFIRLATNQNLITPLDNTPGSSVAKVADEGWRRLFGIVKNIFPDVERFDWSAYVAEGFNVPTGAMALNALMLAGYLLPWMVLGYLLMKSREIAN